MAEHIYIGSGKEKTFQNGGSVISLSLEIDELERIYEAYGFKTKSGKRYVRLTVGKRREVGKYGETHTLEVDTWKPDQNAQGSHQNTSNDAGYQKRPQNANTGASRADTGIPEPPDFPDDIPF